jgi:hypothetical protein
MNFVKIAQIHSKQVTFAVAVQQFFPGKLTREVCRSHVHSCRNPARKGQPIAAGESQSKEPPEHAIPRTLTKYSTKVLICQAPAAVFIHLFAKLH